MKFPAVAFDLDGTLYPNYSFYARLVPFLLKEQRYLRAFGKARDRLRAEECNLAAPNCLEVSSGETPGRLSERNLSFYERQAAYMGEILHAKPELLLQKTEKIIYRGWEPIFKKVRLFPHVIETLRALKEAGVRLGLLSDFPPEAKLENLGLGGLWDAVLCSEAIGCLKPGPLPFAELAKTMGCTPGEMLYVGNSFRYDVLGAQGAGMKAAWVVSRSKAKKQARGLKNAPAAELPAKPAADFVFSDYRKLRDYVLT
ncbi:phosphoglycolate phosphatase [Leadbettera azotonutricia ZAS-9]|uniref:Phosphoglycolate phosphatase n=2 Tax=Leadbettera azotonutricia TaxID=150829 RepID=F5Y9T4_LEAAZ|nr:phosphoglycolate phosphatase [Leadbettera azotonutricia ZAS-9]